jgi:hypothetical protein
MKRISLPLLFVLAMIVFSCKKDANDTVKSENGLSGVSKLDAISAAAVAVNQDTIPPAGAVDAKTYGALGNGVHDDTQALQNIINSKNIIVLSKGTYIINSTLKLRTGVKVYGTQGATIKAGNSMSGTLLTLGRYIYLYSINSASVINLNFLPSSSSFKLATWATSVIYIANSSKNTIKYNTINFKQAYNPIGAQGVWITGSISTNNYVGYNKLYTVGIEYAEDGASYNTIIQNTVVNSHSDGMSAHGNSSTFCKGNSVINNTITNAGHMGIEDWGKVDGTLIKGNKVAGTGKSTLEKNDGIGISCVGVNTVAVLNVISDAQMMYMEIGGNNNCRIDSNTINDTQNAITGIVLNFTALAPQNSKASYAAVHHNYIVNCNEAISIQGNISPNALVTDNTIVNSRFIGINVSSNAANFNVVISNNNVIINKPSVVTRRAISTYASTLTTGQKTSVTGNTVTYATSAAKGSGKEVALSIGTNNVNYTSNKVYGNKIVTGGYSVFAISANGYSFKNITVNSNIFSGAIVDLSNLGFVSNVNNTTL